MVARTFRNLQKAMAHSSKQSMRRAHLKSDAAVTPANNDAPRTLRATASNAAETTAARNAVPREVDAPNYRERVYKIVRRIPSGRVMTYGQIAEILGEGYTPRTVGYVMHAADEGVPWQRVINAQGGCSTGRIVLPPDKQQRLLEAEGIRFDARARCDLNQYRWMPEEFDQTNQSEQDKAQASLFSD